MQLHWTSPSQASQTKAAAARAFWQVPATRFRAADVPHKARWTRCLGETVRIKTTWSAEPAPPAAAKGRIVRSGSLEAGQQGHTHLWQCGSQCRAAIVLCRRGGWLPSRCDGQPSARTGGPAGGRGCARFGQRHACGGFNRWKDNVGCGRWRFASMWTWGRWHQCHGSPRAASTHV